MISEEKMIHIVHLVINTLHKEKWVQFPQIEEAQREARKVGLAYLKQFDSVVSEVRKRILSQKNPPAEHTVQWDNLYRKYMEEEIKKRGG